MGQTTSISWCDATFNLWISCTKTSPGCANCYAERQNNHFGWNKAGWGPNAARKRTGEAYWKQPYKWDKRAAQTGVRLRVFGDSLCDVCDDHPSIKQEWRQVYANLVINTPHLDWLWLTKHPDRFNDIWWRLFDWELPSNLWVGITAENQKMWDERKCYLPEIPTINKFVSAEPLLGPITFRFGKWVVDWEGRHNLIADHVRQVIVGSESGPKARHFDTTWAVNIKNQCKENGVAFYMKQINKDGKTTTNIEDFPEELRIREMPQ